MLGKTKLKYIQSLALKQFRDADDVFVAEGPKIVPELLASSNTTLLQLFGLPAWLNEQQPAAGANGPAIVLEPFELEKLSFLQTPNQVLGLFRKPVFTAASGGPAITLLLDTLQDPGNLGTIIRTADWFGITRIVCSKETADAFSPKVVQASMGSVCRVNVQYADLAGFLSGNPGIPAYAATLQGRDLAALPPIKEGFILIGNESRGINPELVALCHHQVRIARRGGAESLNAAVAAGILLSRTAVDE
jgi:TrmH family RNA methyltransferase